jgi:fucose 4-O-acetylase-like acetyltransferase
MRYDIIDSIKGIGILLVIWGHCMFPRSYIIYAFHMPLFFMISGFLFKNQEFGELILKKTKRIIIPFLFFFVVSFLFFLASNFLNLSRSPLSIHFEPISKDRLVFFIKSCLTDFVFGRGVPNNPPLWFLSCIFITILLYNVILTLKVKYQWGLIAISSILAYYLGFIKLALPFKIDVAFAAIVFFHLGFTIKKHLNWIKQRIESVSNISKIALILLCTAIFVFTVFLNEEISGSYVVMMVNQFGNYFLFYISAISGTILIVVVAHTIQYSTVQYLGQNSLVLMCVHYPFVPYIQPLISSYISSNFLCAIFSLTIILPVSIVIIFLCKKIIPFLTGYK